VVDFGYRAIHEMTLKAKAIVKTFYGEPAHRSYFAGCSTGGRQALMEAQRFPEDYDGIIAIAPSNYLTRTLVGIMWAMQATTFDPTSYIPATKLPALSTAVLAACDARDGLTDGILSDPNRCHFDPSSLLCHGADTASCLTPPQVAALKKVYAGPHNSAGQTVFPGYLPGGEEGPNGWGLYIIGSAPGRSLLFVLGVGYFSNLVYEKPDWDPKSFKLDEALKLAESKTGQALNAIDPNLKPFKARGGRLILYHGLSDAAIPATNTIDYYRTVVAKLGQRNTNSFVRLFLAPGMQHCFGGPGPSFFGQSGDGPSSDPEHNMFAALERWVEKGVAPSQVIATKYVDDNPARPVTMTRPLCSYPGIAKYKGVGDTNEAASFVCAVDQKGAP
jgi:pimeloyl-ACP methyl ester carboxylesterase